jgi:tight adherence protein B
MIENLILLAAGAAVLLAGEGIYYLVRYAGERERSELRRRLQSIDEPGHQTLMKERRVARNPALERLLSPLPGVDVLETWLLQTDLSWTVASVLGSGVGLGLVLSATVLVTLGQLSLALVMMPVGIAVPILLVLNSRTRRSAKISEQMPDALDMIVRSLQAGHGVASGFKLVATEMPLPVAVEFGRCFEEQNVGVDFRTAIGNMTRRVPDNLDLRIFAVSVVIQHETGGNLVEILEKIGETVRSRFQFQGKVRTLTAEARISALILGGLPFVAALLINILNPKYMEPLVGDPMGRVMLFSGAVLWMAGFFFMRKLADVEF